MSTSVSHHGSRSAGDRRLRTWVWPAAIVASLVAAGCGSSGDDDEAELPSMPVFTGATTPTTAPADESPTTSTTPPSPTATSTEAPGAGATTTQGPPETITEAAVAAIDIAEAATGGTAYELDEDDGVWVIEVAVDGANHEVTVSSDGITLLSARPDEMVDSDDIGKLAVATIPIQDAVRVAAAEVGGDVSEVDLDTENGVVVWEVTVEVGDDDLEVYVSATTAAVIRVES